VDDGWVLRTWDDNEGGWGMSWRVWELLGTRYLHRGSLMADGLLSMRWGFSISKVEGCGNATIALVA
jgi:hypothetical protein